MILLGLKKALTIIMCQLYFFGPSCRGITVKERLLMNNMVIIRRGACQRNSLQGLPSAGALHCTATYALYYWLLESL